MTAPEARILDSMTPAGMGYAESKWVAEQVLETAAQKTDLSPVIIRPGQLSGGVAGAWKTSEWFPTLLRSSQLLGHLPTIPGVSTPKLMKNRLG
jgi:thioester reductase-like protein